MYFELAKRNLMRTKVRSILAIIGIVIGVMAISSIGIFGEGLKKTVLERFEDIANEIIITPSFSGGYSSIDKTTISKIEKISYLSSVIPLKNEGSLVYFKNKKTFTIIYGMNRDAIMELFEIEKGSNRLSGSCIVGSNLAERMKLRVGNKIVIREREFNVAGILKEEGARFDIRPNNAIIISEKDFTEIFGVEDYSMVIVKVESLGDIEKFKDAVEKTINSRDKKVRVLELRSILERITQAFNQINLFLLAIAGVSLLVAGVSILNIMLMSTLERTKEIGIMRAVGASRHTILRIFLYEALILGLIGSVTGGILSIFGGYFIELAILQSAKHIFSMATLYSILQGIFFGLVTAVVSGFYPAFKASKLEPIEALRYE
ncbi:ABC transporter permease [Archaeoglobales archaeon]|nr:MAG: ABC transporter permease [Archaeoglobales archaeon]